MGSVGIVSVHGQSLYTVSLYSTVSVSSFGTEAMQSNHPIRLGLCGKSRDLLDTDVCQLG